jgi:hypothetical protein
LTATITGRQAFHDLRHAGVDGLELDAEEAVLDAVVSDQLVRDGPGPIASGRKLDAADCRITAHVGIGPLASGGFGLSATLDLDAPNRIETRGQPP